MPGQGGAPQVDDVGVVRQRQRGQRVLLDQQHRGALGLQLLDRREDLLRHDRREPHRGLVEHEQLRARHHRPPDREHLLLAAGEQPRLVRAPLPQHREQLVHPVQVLAGCPASSLRVYAPRRRFSSTVIRANSRRPSGLCATPRARISCAGSWWIGSPVQQHLARHRAQQPGDRAQRGGLARPVAADQADDLALLDGERHPAHGLDRAVGDGQVADLEEAVTADPPHGGALWTRRVELGLDLVGRRAEVGLDDPRVAAHLVRACPPRAARPARARAPGRTG